MAAAAGGMPAQEQATPAAATPQRGAIEGPHQPPRIPIIISSKGDGIAGGGSSTPDAHTPPALLWSDEEPTDAFGTDAGADAPGAGMLRQGGRAGNLDGHPDEERAASSPAPGTAGRGRRQRAPPPRRSPLPRQPPPSQQLQQHPAAAGHQPRRTQLPWQHLRQMAAGCGAAGGAASEQALPAAGTTSSTSSRGGTNAIRSSAGVSTTAARAPAAAGQLRPQGSPSARAAAALLDQVQALGSWREAAELLRRCGRHMQQSHMGLLWLRLPSLLEHPSAPPTPGCDPALQQLWVAMLRLTRRRAANLSPIALAAAAAGLRAAARAACAPAKARRALAHSLWCRLQQVAGQVTPRQLGEALLGLERAGWRAGGAARARELGALLTGASAQLRGCSAAEAAMLLHVLALLAGQPAVAASAQAAGGGGGGGSNAGGTRRRRSSSTSAGEAGGSGYTARAAATAAQAGPAASEGWDGSGGTPGEGAPTGGEAGGSAEVGSAPQLAASAVLLTQRLAAGVDSVGGAALVAGISAALRLGCAGLTAPQPPSQHLAALPPPADAALLCPGHPADALQLQPQQQQQQQQHLLEWPSQQQALQQPVPAFDAVMPPQLLDVLLAAAEGKLVEAGAAELASLLVALAGCRVEPWEAWMGRCYEALQARLAAGDASAAALPPQHLLVQQQQQQQQSWLPQAPPQQQVAQQHAASLHAARRLPVRLLADLLGVLPEFEAAPGDALLWQLCRAVTPRLVDCEPQQLAALPAQLAVLQHRPPTTWLRSFYQATCAQGARAAAQPALGISPGAAAGSGASACTCGMVGTSAGACWSASASAPGVASACSCGSAAGVWHGLPPEQLAALLLGLAQLAPPLPPPGWAAAVEAGMTAPQSQRLRPAHAAAAARAFHALGHEVSPAWVAHHLGGAPDGRSWRRERPRDEPPPPAVHCAAASAAPMVAAETPAAVGTAAADSARCAVAGDGATGQAAAGGAVQLAGADLAAAVGAGRFLATCAGVERPLAAHRGLPLLVALPARLPVAGSDCGASQLQLSGQGQHMPSWGVDQAVPAARAGGK